MSINYDCFTLLLRRDPRFFLYISLDYFHSSQMMPPMGAVAVVVVFFFYAYLLSFR